MSFEKSFEFLLKWEGGYSNLASDPGGATNLGVIQSEYDNFRREKGLQLQSVARITRDEAEAIYRAKYWDAVRCDELNPGTANAVFDASVNSGSSRGVRWLQQAINQVAGREMVIVDESIGPKTLTAAALCPPDKLIDTMLALRLAFMHVAHHPKTGALLWSTFGRGWSDRINGVRVQSHNLAGLPTPTKPLSQPKETTFMAWLGTLFVSLLANTQIQSVLRTTLKVAGTALVMRAGGDVGNMDTIVGGIVAAIGVFGSMVTHSPTVHSPTVAAAA